MAEPSTVYLAASVNGDGALIEPFEAFRWFSDALVFAQSLGRAAAIVTIPVEQTEEPRLPRFRRNKRA